jgi:hypothetical protein
MGHKGLKGIGPGLSQLAGRPPAGYLLLFPRRGWQQGKSQGLRVTEFLGAKAALQDGLWRGGLSPGVRISPGTTSASVHLY